AMQKSLTYFAITNLKPAIAVETSKNITELDLKVIYQLRSFEALMEVMGIEYSKNIELTREAVQKSIDEYGTLKLNDRFTLDLSDVKFATRYVPMKKSDNKIEFSHPLGSVVKRDNYYDIHIGHMRVATVYPQYFDFNCDIKGAKLEIDGKTKEVNFGDIVEVEKAFKVVAQKGIRVNVIGFVGKNKKSQDNTLIKRTDIIERFAMDNKNRTFRVEFYDGNNFCGMIGVKFK
ncbi:MAG: M99 family metallo-carboxypeptidase C-terminal domain-containing protein, partial [Arcobacteraceae bacterium]